MRYSLSTFIIVLILTGCNSDKPAATKTNLEIREPQLAEIESSDTEFSQAIDNIQKHLIKLNVPVDSMYYVGVDSTLKGKWQFRLIHFDNYKIQAKYELEKKRIDSLEKAGVTEYDFNFIPPTGNWGGYDRTIIYSKSKHEIIADLVDQ